MELLGIRRALKLWMRHVLGKPVVEGELANVVTWAKGRKKPPWRLISMVRDTRKLFARNVAVFKHVRHTSNVVVGFWAQTRVDKHEAFVDIL